MNNAPIRSALQVAANFAEWSPPWANWFAAVTRALGGWSSSLQASATLNFPNTLAGAQSALTVSVPGALIGQGAMVLPAADVAGIAFKGAVTALDTVTVYALNCTAVAIDPPSQSYRVIVLAP
jgi:hypothetical protein